jgi:hypothetical protein
MPLECKNACEFESLLLVVDFVRRETRSWPEPLLDHPPAGEPGGSRWLLFEEASSWARQRAGRQRSVHCTKEPSLGPTVVKTNLLILQHREGRENDSFAQFGVHWRRGADKEALSLEG